LAFMGTAIVGWTGLDALAERFEGSDTPLEGRRPIWEDAMKIIRAFPLAGTGLNTFDEAMVEYERDYAGMNGSPAFDAHNDYLELTSDGGLLMVIPAAILVLVLIREIRRRLKEDPPDSGVYWTRMGA